MSLTHQEKASQIGQEARNTIAQTKKKLTKLLEQLNMLSGYNYIITSKEDAKTLEQIQDIRDIIQKLNTIYNEL